MTTADHRVDEARISGSRLMTLILRARPATYRLTAKLTGRVAASPSTSSLVFASLKFGFVVADVHAQGFSVDLERLNRTIDLFDHHG